MDAASPRFWVLRPSMGRAALERDRPALAVRSAGAGSWETRGWASRHSPFHPTPPVSPAATGWSRPTPGAGHEPPRLAKPGADVPREPSGPRRACAPGAGGRAASVRRGARVRGLAGAAGVGLRPRAGRSAHRAVGGRSSGRSSPGQYRLRCAGTRRPADSRPGASGLRGGRGGRARRGRRRTSATWRTGSDRRSTTGFRAKLGSTRRSPRASAGSGHALPPSRPSLPGSSTAAWPESAPATS